MLRVDFESPITEKDKDSGYFLFNFADSGKLRPGSIEVVRVQEGNLESVRVVVQVPALPNYVEQMLLDRLARKLGQDYGQPPTTKAAAPTTGASSEQTAAGTAANTATRDQPAKTEPKTERPQSDARAK